MSNRLPTLAVVAALIAAVVTLDGQQPEPARQGGPVRFKSGVDLVNVTATVVDENGRFVSGLRREDFRVYEDDRLQDVTQFNAERVPVSLGIALDTSKSMAGLKITEARRALDRFLYELLDRRDEIFLYRFGDHPVLVQGWTEERAPLTAALGRITPDGGTAMYDTVAAAIPLAAQGVNRKKALLLISDGNDTSSEATLPQVKASIRDSEVLVYAIGIDGERASDTSGSSPQPPWARPPDPPLPRPRPPIPDRFPVPLPTPGRRPGFILTSFMPGSSIGVAPAADDDRANVIALRALTDESGGRTEIIRDARDLNPATAGIADELSKQYYLGYISTGEPDGRWHSIRVEVKNSLYRVRARQGYIAN